MDMTFKAYKVEIKAIDTDKKTVTAIVSTNTKDRDGDIVPPESMKKRIKTYKARPLLLADHDYSTESHIGQAQSIKLNDDHVEAKLEYFAGKGNPKADWAWELAQKGMAAYSIGFRTFDYDWIKEKDAKGNEDITGRHFKDIELLEISHVAVPANQEALQLAINDETVDIEVKEACEVVLKGFKEGKIKFPEVKAIKDANDGDAGANVASQIEAMNKRVSAIETSVNQATSQFASFQSQIEDFEERLTGMEQAAVPGSPGAADGNLDPANTAPGKHYSAVKVGKDGKTVPEPKTVTPKAKMRLDFSSIKETLTNTQKELKPL